MERPGRRYVRPPLPERHLNPLSLDDPKMPPIASRLNLTKLFIELSLFTPALMALQGIMASDDEEVEAWYLEGWCFFLMAEQAREHGGKLDELTWEELARDSRDCLETCKTVRLLDTPAIFRSHFRVLVTCQSRASRCSFTRSCRGAHIQARGVGSKGIPRRRLGWSR